MFARTEKYIRADLERVLRRSARARCEWFDELKVQHLYLHEAHSRILSYLDRGDDTNIIFLVGMTGIGKTSLARNGITSAIKERWIDEVESTDLPSIFISSKANGQKSFSWKGIYQSVIKACTSMPVESVRATISDGDVVRLESAKQMTVLALRDAMGSALVHRKVRVIMLDEAYHLLRFEKLEAVMDTLKSIADEHKIKIILIGSFDLIPLALQYGQAIRRGEGAPFFRYRSNKVKEKNEFRIIVDKFASNWPCERVPNFVAFSDELMDASSGAIGFLKSILSNFLRLQIRAPAERWRAEMFAQSIKSEAMSSRLRIEVEEGEQELRECFALCSKYVSNAGLKDISKKLAA